MRARSVYGDLGNTLDNLCLFNYQCHVYLCNRGPYVSRAFMYRASDVSVHRACCERATQPYSLGAGGTICPGSVRSRSTQDHHLTNFAGPDSLMLIQVRRSSACWFQRRRFLKFCLPYMGMTVIFVIWPGPFEHTFILTTHKSSTWNLASMGLAALQQKIFESLIWVILDKGQTMTLTSDTHMYEGCPRNT